MQRRFNKATCFLAEDRFNDTQVQFVLTREYGSYGRIFIKWNVSSRDNLSVTDVYPTTGMVEMEERQRSALLNLFVAEDQVYDFMLIPESFLYGL